MAIGGKQRWEIRWQCARFVVHGRREWNPFPNVLNSTPFSVEALTQRVLLGWSESSCVQHVMHPAGSAGHDEPYS